MSSAAPSASGPPAVVGRLFTGLGMTVPFMEMLFDCERLVSRLEESWLELRLFGSCPPKERSEGVRETADWLLPALASNVWDCKCAETIESYPGNSGFGKLKDVSAFAAPNSGAVPFIWGCAMARDAYCC